jgi:hypothetical protein
MKAVEDLKTAVLKILHVDRTELFSTAEGRTIVFDLGKVICPGPPATAKPIYFHASDRERLFAFGS